MKSLKRFFVWCFLFITVFFGIPSAFAVSVDMTKWDTYQNQTGGFSIQSPLDWEPLVNQATTYKQGEFRSRTDVCFASRLRQGMSCKVEIYVTNQLDRFLKLKEDSFLGFERLTTDEEPYSPAIKDGTATSRLDVITRSGTFVSNIFVEKDGFVYLFVMRNFNQDELDYATFLSMIKTFMFLDDPLRDVADLSPTFQRLVSMRPDQLQFAQIKLTYLGEQDKMIRTTIFTTPDNSADANKFFPYRRSGIFYGNDNIPVRSLAVSTQQIKSLLTELESFPYLVSQNAFDPPYLSFSILNEGDDTDQFLETILNRRQTKDLFVLLRKTFEENKDAGKFFQGWGCALDLLGTKLALDVSEKIEVKPWGGVRFNQTTGLFEQTVTLKNISSERIPGPISLLVDFVNHVKLSNADGLTCRLTPNGLNFLNVPLPSGRLGFFNPDELLEVVLQFDAIEDGPVQFTTKVFATDGER